MSCTEYEYETVEIIETTIEKQGEAPRSKPVAVKRLRVRPGDQVTCRVTQALDLQLAQGSMPA